ncbi:MAG: LytTR family DNA-binding domain-containing protein [Bacteroidota bacterium]
MPLKALIIEDELPAQKVLKTYITDLPQLELIECFNNALAAIPFLQQNEIEVIFLDINLPKLSGLDFLKSMAYSPKVILTTAYPNYALEGFDLDVVDYLLKPFSFQRFVQAVNKLQVITPAKSMKSEDVKEEQKEIEELFIKVDKVFYRVNVADICYLKSERDFVRIVTSEKKHLVLQNLKYYEALLPHPPFVRVHKSFIINLKKVDMVFGNTARIGAEDIPIGRTYRENLLSLIEVNRS